MAVGPDDLAVWSKGDSASTGRACSAGSEGATVGPAPADAGDAAGPLTTTRPLAGSRKAARCASISHSIAAMAVVTADNGRITALINSISGTNVRRNPNARAAVRIATVRVRPSRRLPAAPLTAPMLKAANRNATGPQVAVDGGGGVAAVAAAVRKVARRRIGRMSVRAAAPPT